MKQLLTLALCSSAALAYGQTADQKAPTREVRNTTGASLNLLGVQSALDLTWRWSITDSTNPVVADAHKTIGITNAFSPAYNRVGVWFEYSPLSILDFRVGVDPTLYFGTFSSVTDFENADAAYDPDTVASRKDDLTPGFGGRIYFEPTFKIKVKNVIFASYADFELWKLFTGSENFFYEPARDTLIRSQGDAIMTGSGVLLYDLNLSPGNKLIAGIAYDMLRPFGAPQNQRQTIGPLAVFSFDRRLGPLNRPSLITKAYFYAQDRADLGKVGEIGGQVAVRFFLGE